MCRKCGHTNCRCSHKCGCDFEVDASCVRYTGEELANLGISEGENLEDALESISEAFENIELTPGPQGEEGDDGAPGQGVDHVSFLSSTGTPSSTPNQPGETDTYTVWGDLAETINLGTFDVYNGDDGADGADGQSVDHVSFTIS